jgi:phenol 2-monooxygenase
MTFPTRTADRPLQLQMFIVRLSRNIPPGTVEAIILQPDMAPAWHFDDLPACIKDEVEMRLYCASQEVYAAYGVDTQRGALVLVRPDGMVGMIADLGDVGLLERLLGEGACYDVVDARK